MIRPIIFMRSLERRTHGLDTIDAEIGNLGARQQGEETLHVGVGVGFRGQVAAAIAGGVIDAFSRFPGEAAEVVKRAGWAFIADMRVTSLCRPTVSRKGRHLAEWMMEYQGSNMCVDWSRLGQVVWLSFLRRRQRCRGMIGLWDRARCLRPVRSSRASIL